MLTVVTWNLTDVQKVSFMEKRQIFCISTVFQLPSNQSLTTHFHAQLSCKACWKRTATRLRFWLAAMSCRLVQIPSLFWEGPEWQDDRSAAVTRHCRASRRACPNVSGHQWFHIRTGAKNFMDSVTSTEGGITNTTAWFKGPLAHQQRAATKTKQRTDRPGYSNKHSGTPSCFTGRKKKRNTCPAHTRTHTHTNIFKYSSLIFNSSFIQQ